jgi:ATP-binding cassette subfamily C protein LapB
MRRQQSHSAFQADALRDVLVARAHAEHDPVFFGIFALVCTRLLPNLMIKDVLGSLPLATQESTGERLLATLRSMGFTARPLKRSLDRLKPWHFPALFVSDDEQNAFLLLHEEGQCVALGADGDAYLPETLPGGALYYLGQEAHIDPLSAESRKHTRYSWLRALLAAFAPLRHGILWATLAVTVLSILQPFAISAFYRAVFSDGDVTGLPWLAGAMILLVLGLHSAMKIRSRALAWLAARLNYLVGRATFEKIMQLPAVRTLRLDAKDQSARVRSFENVSDFLTSPLALTLLDAPAAILGLALIGWIFPPVGILLTVFALLYGKLIMFGAKRMKVLTSKMSDLATDLQHAMVETFEKRELIRECGLQYRWADLQKRRIARAQGVNLEIARLMAVVEAVASLVFSVAFISVIGLMAELGRNYGLSGPAMLGVILLTSMVLSPLHGLCLALPRFEQSSRAVQQINEFMALESEMELDAQRRRLPSIQGIVALRNVSMRIGDGRPVILGLDFATAPGEVLGITGAAGSGKSMILKLLQGMLPPSFGTVLIEGVDIEQLPLRALRSALGYLPQKPALLPGSLRDNLTMANPLADDRQISNVLSLVGLADIDLDGAPPPYDLADTFIWQFALAQALLVGQGLLLIDEIPNNILNNGFGIILHNVLRSAKGRLTVLFVSNRSDLLALASRVLVLRHGNTPLLMSPEALAEAA